MKSIKLLSVLLFSLLMCTAFAQQRQPGQGQRPQGQGQRMQGQGQRMQRTPEQTTQTQVDWMTKDLSLDQATAKKVYDCVLKYNKQSSTEMQKLGQGSSREAMTAKRQEITTARDKELKAILGDSKFDLFKKKEAERRTAAAGRQRQG